MKVLTMAGAVRTLGSQRAREQGILPAWEVLGLGDGGTSASPDVSH